VDKVANITIFGRNIGSLNIAPPAKAHMLRPAAIAGVGRKSPARAYTQNATLDFGIIFFLKNQDFQHQEPSTHDNDTRILSRRSASTEHRAP